MMTMLMVMKIIISGFDEEDIVDHDDHAHGHGDDDDDDDDNEKIMIILSSNNNATIFKGNQ